MKKILTLISITSTMILGTIGSTEAQKRRVRYADEQMELMNYQHAVEVYKEAYSTRPDYETAKKTAQAYEVLRDYENTFTWWATTVRDYEESTPADYIQLLRYAQLTDHLEEALGILESKGVGQDSLRVYELLKLQGKRKVKVEGVEGLNSSGSDFVLSKDNKGNKYFTSDRGSTYSEKMPRLRIDGRNRFFSKEKQDFMGREYFSVYRQDEEGKLSKVVSNIPDTYNFSDPSYAAKEGLLFYSVTRGITKVKKICEIVVQPEVYFSRLNEDGTLDGFTSVPFNDSISYAVMNPYVDEELKRLYFTSDMPGGLGGTDLYYSEYDDNMSFGPPVNLGDAVNTAGNESHAFRKKDKFYFSSTGHIGLGGMDIFMADFGPDGMSNIENMGSPVNSIADDFAYRELNLESGKREVYLSSNREGGMGQDDIYQVKEQYKQFLARVINCEGLLVGDNYFVTLTDKTQKRDVQISFNDQRELTAELEPKSDFELKISKPGFFSIIDGEITSNEIEGDTVKREYELMSIPYNFKIYLVNVYYDLDKFEARDDAMPIMDKLADLMNRYSFLYLLVNSHTDSRASKEYNNKLSNLRAESVRNYFTKNNISPNRILIKWFGEQELINDCGDGVPCPESAHQLNRRSELVIGAFPNPDTQYEMPNELKGENFCDLENLFFQIQQEIEQVINRK